MGPNVSWNIDLPAPHVFPQLGLVSGHMHSAYRCVNTSQVVYKYTYVSEELLKNLVHGALIETEILTSPLCHVFAQFGQVLGTGTLSAGVSPPAKWSRNGPMCLRNLQKVFGAWALIEAEILTSTTPTCICSNSGQFWVLALCPNVCQHLPSSLEMFLCVSGTSKKYLVHGALIEAGILISPLCHVFAQLVPVLGTGTLSAGVSTPPKWV